MSPRGRLIAVPLGCLGAALLLFAPMVVAHLVEAGLPDGQRFGPEVHDRTTLAAAFAVAGTTLALVILLAFVSRRALAGRRARFKVLYVSGVLLGHLIALGGLSAAAISTDPHLFGGGLMDCTTAPDQRVRACLYEGGMMCGYSVYVGPTSGHVLTHRERIARICDEMPRTASLRWRLDGSTVEVVDDTGHVIGSQTITLLPVLR